MFPINKHNHLTILPHTGPGRMVVLIAELQGECDTHANAVIDMFKANTNFSEKVTEIERVNRLSPVL